MHCLYIYIYIYIYNMHIYTATSDRQLISAAARARRSPAGRRAPPLAHRGQRPVSYDNRV